MQPSTVKIQLFYELMNNVRKNRINQIKTTTKKLINYKGISNKIQYNMVKTTAVMH